MSSKSKRVDPGSEGASRSDEQEITMLVVPANKSSDSTSTTYGTTSSSSNTTLLSNPSSSTATAVSQAATTIQEVLQQGELGAVDNEPSASSSSSSPASPITTTPNNAITSLKEQGQQLLNNTILFKPEHINEAQQLMNSLKEQGQAVYLQLSDEATKAVAALSLSTSGNNNSGEDNIASFLQQPTLVSSTIKSEYEKKSSASAGEEEDSNTNNENNTNDLDLKQTYPLSLQRSASSAFGSPPRTNTDQNKGGGCATRRSHSNSGHISDPGIAMSAFHPVWR